MNNADPDAIQKIKTTICETEKPVKQTSVTQQHYVTLYATKQINGILEASLLIIY